MMSLQRSRIEARSSSLDAQMAHRSARPAMCHLPVGWSAEAKKTSESCSANHTLFARKTPSSCALSTSRRVCSLAADDGSVTWHKRPACRSPCRRSGVKPRAASCLVVYREIDVQRDGGANGLWQSQQLLIGGDRQGCINQQFSRCTLARKLVLLTRETCSPCSRPATASNLRSCCSTVSGSPSTVGPHSSPHLATGEWHGTAVLLDIQC